MLSKTLMSSRRIRSSRCRPSCSNSVRVSSEDDVEWQTPDSALLGLLEDSLSQRQNSGNLAGRERSWSASLVLSLTSMFDPRRSE